MFRNVVASNTWTPTFFTLLCFIITFDCSVDAAAAKGNIGCLFVDSVCLDDVEWCFDDYAFGKCLPKYGYEPDDMSRSPLSEDQSHILSTMLEELQGAGLGWDHPFVQCRMQGAIFSLRNAVLMPSALCADIAPDPQVLDPHSPLAFVRFTPPNDDYADEVYSPPEEEDLIHQPPPPLPPQSHGFDDRYATAPMMRRDDLYPMDAAKSKRTGGRRVFNDDDDDSDIDGENSALANRIKDIKNRIELRRMMAEYEAGNLKPPVYYRGPIDVGAADYPSDAAANDMIDMPTMDDDEQQQYFRTDDKRTSFREIARNNHLPGGEDFEQTNELPLEPAAIIKSNHLVQSNELLAAAPSEAGVYTEGGLVFVPNSDSKSHAALERKLEASNLLANMLGFTRHERLDVKKPGPPAAPPPAAIEEARLIAVKDVTKEVVPAHIKEDQLPKIKKLLHTEDDHGPHSVDTEYTHVILKTPIENWTDGPRIVAALADTLNMQNFFTFSRVDRHEISFRVEPNPEKKTATDVARAINDSRFKNNLQRRYGVVLVRAGVGDKTKEPLTVSISKVDAASEGPDVTHVMAYMFAGAGAAAVIVICITLFLIRRHDQKREKLGGLQAGLAGTETSSKDYQELCRARMAGKGNAANDSSATANSGRITSICKENEKPPSSRSSTSSWSEEPAMTNMDISTGHMVLSYMEDHLRNKGRLQREWEALCRYEAEPSSREAATQQQCEPLNRPGAPLPYDHSRLVINHLTNAEGLDYINASTITDHDPRAPAYVAAQGPLPSTLAHFWQMIWEQGSVVIVSLCRLQENGDIACARYWPEEGSEVYHIYEVHLVSEHIWCDDYLVRSFYLKNLRTSETRTVTQFHFLSWPQAGVPVAAKALLEFRRKVNKSYRGRSCPVVVHSSNGAGRTGAYILLDLVLARMNKGAREIDIAATLEHLRDQRSGLVATRQQFEFVLMAVAEEVHAILKALPASAQPEKRELDSDVVKEPAAVAATATTAKNGERDKDAETEKNGKEKSDEKTKSTTEKK